MRVLTILTAAGSFFIASIFQQKENPGRFLFPKYDHCASYVFQNGHIQLDGVVNNAEWAGADEYELSGGGKVRIKKEGNDLFIALLAEKKAWAHVYLHHTDTVKVLHASAALGEARYVKKDGLWRISLAFEWDLRDRVYNDSLARKQQGHFLKHGWVANNNNMGNGMQFEYRLNLLRMDNPASIACVVAEIPLNIHFFPSSIIDNTTLPRLVQGYVPDSLNFDPGSWKKISR